MKYHNISIWPQRVLPRRYMRYEALNPMPSPHSPCHLMRGCLLILFTDLAIQIPQSATLVHVCNAVETFNCRSVDSYLILIHRQVRTIHYSLGSLWQNHSQLCGSQTTQRCDHEAVNEISMLQHFTFSHLVLVNYVVRRDGDIFDFSLLPNLLALEPSVEYDL